MSKMTEAKLREQIFDIITDAPCRKCGFWDWQGRYCWLKNMHPDSRKCTLLDQILELMPKYEPVQLEALTDDELADLIWNKVEGVSSISHLRAAAQENNARNEAKGQLYRKI